MNIIEKFGEYVEQLSEDKPENARKLLKTGWHAQNFRFKYMPDKRLMPSDQYLAQFMMDMMIEPLKHPERSVIVSIFTPCELLQEAGLSPYNALFIRI